MSEAYPRGVSHTVERGPGAETESWVRSVFEVLGDVPAVRRVGVALAEGGGRRLSFTASDRDHERGIDWCVVDAYEDVPLNNAVRTGKLVVGSLDDLAHRYPDFVGRQDPEFRAVASVPLSTAGRVLGGFALFYGALQPFDDPQLKALRTLGKRLADDLRRVHRGKIPRGRRSLVSEPVPAGAQAATHVVAGDPQGVALARQFVRATLRGWGIEGDPVESAVLCVSELVTNAIIHTVAGCEVRVVLHQGVLTATVRDGGTAVRRSDRSADDPLAVHGRGLRILDALAARWGSALDPVGMTVWCELPVG